MLRFLLFIFFSNKRIGTWYCQLLMPIFSQVLKFIFSIIWTISVVNSCLLGFYSFYPWFFFICTYTWYVMQNFFCFFSIIRLCITNWTNYRKIWKKGRLSNKCYGVTLYLKVNENKFYVRYPYFRRSYFVQTLRLSYL